MSGIGDPISAVTCGGGFFRTYTLLCGPCAVYVGRINYSLLLLLLLLLTEVMPFTDCDAKLSLCASVLVAFTASRAEHLLIGFSSSAAH